MRTILVVNPDPLLSDVLDLIKVFKDMGTEYFMTVSTVKAFNKGILLRFTRLDKLQLYSFFLALTHKDRRPKFAPIV
jgi:hypothetical protein